ncbi:hypothetical protein [Salininema proteolyticum]|uniref:Uncharacterized protein n=1 Tax=Salininema proteolyticum TaxID=1607685 RepID=A0ABV8TZ05_9ACTN
MLTFSLPGQRIHDVMAAVDELPGDPVVTEVNGQKLTITMLTTPKRWSWAAEQVQRHPSYYMEAEDFDVTPHPRHGLELWHLTCYKASPEEVADYNPAAQFMDNALRPCSYPEENVHYGNVVIGVGGFDGEVVVKGMNRDQLRTVLQPWVVIGGEQIEIREADA